MEKYFINIFYWIIRIVFYYVIYKDIEMFSVSIMDILTIILIYFIPNIMFKMIGAFIDKVNRNTKKS